jgi:putative phosphoesterase
MRIAVLSDAHANRPALEAAFEATTFLGCDSVVHTGDAIGIGPHPAECLDLLVRSEAELVLGNHDAYFAFGLDNWQYSEEELEHQRWVHDQLDPALRSTVADWPRRIDKEVNGVTLVFTHYGLEPDQSFSPPGRNTTCADLDRMFRDTAGADVVFFGHDHAALDCLGRRRYINPGSLGCHTKAEARFCVIDVSEEGGIVVERHSIGYDDGPVFQDLEARQVPAREFIRRAFLPRPETENE